MSSAGGGEADLIERARSGDAEAFSCLARTYERRIYSLALYYCRERADAEDLSQEVWLRAYKALGTFRGDASFYTWLRRIMVNVFLDHKYDETKRRANGSSLIEIDARDDTNESNTPVALRTNDLELDTHQHILIERVMHALDDLTAQQRLIFLLKHREGMTADEIASLLNCSAGTVKKSLFRVIIKLRQHFGVETEKETYNSSSYRARAIY